MEIEQFVAQSEGFWRSMRSGHSLAFKYFDNLVSQVTVKKLLLTDPQVTKLLSSHQNINSKPISPFEISWRIEDDWIGEDLNQPKSGSSIFIPIPTSSENGDMIRSRGYAETIESVSNYKFHSDGTFYLKSVYGTTFAEERIWFISENLRCRSSVIRNSNSLAILQTSFASEIKLLNNS